MNIFRGRRDQALNRYLSPRTREKILDLPPGRYKVTLKLERSAAQQREFEVAANETWGLLVGPDGAPLPIRLF